MILLESPHRNSWTEHKRGQLATVLKVIERDTQGTFHGLGSLVAKQRRGEASAQVILYRDLKVPVRVPSRRGINQALQGVLQLGLFVFPAATAGPGPPLPTRGQRLRIIKLSNPGPNRPVREPRGLSHRRDTAPAERSGFRRSPVILAGHADFETTHRFYLAVADDLIDRARQAITHRVSPELLAKCCRRSLKDDQAACQELVQNGARPICEAPREKANKHNHLSAKKL